MKKEFIIVENKLANKTSAEIKEIIENLPWKHVVNMHPLTKDATTADALFGGIQECAADEGAAGIVYMDSEGVQRKLVVFYNETTAAVYRVTANGKPFNKKLRKKDKEKNRHKVNTPGNGCMHINELIHRINNIANGVIDDYGQQYNHHVMVSLRGEKLGHNEGSMCSSEQNTAHCSLCTRLNKALGIIPSVKSYYTSDDNVYALLNLKEITMDDVMKYHPRVVDGIYYFD